MRRGPSERGFPSFPVPPLISSSPYSISFSPSIHIMYPFSFPIHPPLSIPPSFLLLPLVPATKRPQIQLRGLGKCCKFPGRVRDRAKTTTAFLFLSRGNVSDVCRWREGKAIALGGPLPISARVFLSLAVS